MLKNNYQHLVRKFAVRAVFFSITHLKRRIDKVVDLMKTSADKP